MWIVVVLVIAVIVVAIVQSSRKKGSGRATETESAIEPRPTGSFSDEFRWLSSFIGGSESALLAALGKPDDTDRAWMWFKSVHTGFCVGQGRVFRLSVPTMDASGHRLTDVTDHYEVEGVRPGMSKTQVRETWGKFSNDNWDQGRWCYHDRAIRTRTGALAVPYVDFGVESECVETFSVDLLESRS